MSRRRFGPEEETAVLAAYAEQPSVARAAAVAGVGATWAYNVLRRAGVVRQTLVFPASLAVEARKIYLEQNLSCREVAAILASRLAPASGPSQQWVCDRMREAGVLRDKSQANRIRESRRNRRDYAALAERASELYRQGLSTKEIARRLQVTHGAVGRWVDQRRESLSRGDAAPLLAGTDGGSRDSSAAPRGGPAPPRRG